MGLKLTNHHWFLFQFLVFAILISPLDCHRDSKILGPASTVSKHLCFPDFRADRDKRLHHDLKLLGSAKFEEKEGMIQIPDTEIEDLKHQAGRAIYSSPIRLLDPHTQTAASFNTTFSFQIDRSSSGAGNLNSGGSGLTFIIVPDEVTVGRPGPWLAMLNDACDDDYKTFAVEFDTFRNRDFGDPNDNHVGINLGSIVSSVTIDAADVGVSFRDGSIVRAWISYSGNHKTIDLRLGDDGNEIPMKPLYSAPLDLSPFLNEYMFVGFSASTGNFTQIHNIRTWNFSSTSEAYLRVPTEETCESKFIFHGEKNPSRREPPSAFLVFIAVVILCLMVVLNLYCNGKTRKKSELVSGVLSAEIKKPRPPNKPHRFSIAEISSATKCFSEMEMVGSSYRGVLHRGILSNSCCIAVKRFSPKFLQSCNADRRRITKSITELSRIRHPNLVPVRGWCYDKRETMVVYDYMRNGSIDQWLFAKGSVLPWTRRYKFIRDIAEALCFLHSKKLTHKNVKTSNVLVDVSFRGVLGDFGIVGEAREEPIGANHDVYGFGLMVLEIVSGRRSVDLNLEKEERDLLDWCWRLQEKEKVMLVVDKELKVYNVEQVGRVVGIGLMCTVNDDRNDARRPSMEEVASYLNMERAMPPLPAQRALALFPYNSTSDLCSLRPCTPFALGRK